MDSSSRIRKIIGRTNCTYDQAVEADKLSNGDVNKAVEIVTSRGNELYIGGGSSGLAVDSGPRKHTLEGYKNGLLVDGKFYDYSQDENIKLQEMLKRGEFDAGILGEETGTAEVVYKDYTDREYEQEKKAEKRNFDDANKHTLSFSDKKIEFTNSCPDEIILDPEGDVIFKVFIEEKRVTVRMNSRMFIPDFYREMKKYTKTSVVLTTRGNCVNDDLSSSNLRNSMFILKKRE